jgi:hypothetical protein
MTREEAKELVEDLLQAWMDYENHPVPAYGDEYRAAKERVIEALCSDPR